MKNILWIFYLSFLVAETPFNWDENGSPIRQGAHIEWWKSIETGNEGEFFVVWSDTRFGIRDIFAQKVTVNGEMLWGVDGDPVALEDGLPDGIPVVLAPGRQEDQANSAHQEKFENPTHLIKKAMISNPELIGAKHWMYKALA